jgi:hypothetical protein
MPQGSFTAQVNAFVSKSKERVIAVRNASAQEVMEIASTPRSEGGNLPFKTGFLRRSVRATIGEPQFTTIDAPKDGGSLSGASPAEVVMTIANAGLNDTMSFVWTASYAMRMEWGFVGTDSLGRNYNQSGYRFVGLAAQQWPQIVERKAAELQARLS